MQANTCRSPNCSNFRKFPDLGKQARGAKRAYHLAGAASGIQCTSCGRTFALYSNAALRKEIDRLSSVNTGLTGRGCPNNQCANAARSVESAPGEYFRHGRTTAGQQRLRCRRCRRTFVPGGVRPASKRDEITKPIARAFVNRAPIRGICRTFGASPNQVYERLRYIHARMVRFEAAKIQKLEALKRHRRIRLALATDAQDQLVNWWSRDRRSPVQLSAIATADNLSGFIFRTDINFDPRIGDAGRHFEELLSANDFNAPGGLGLHHAYEREPFLEAAVWCLERDIGEGPPQPRLSELKTAQAAAQQMMTKAPTLADIQGSPAEGVIIKRIYTAIAHFTALDAMLPPEARLHLMTDPDHSLVAAALIAMGERINDLRVDFTFVNFAKELSQTQKERRVAAYRRALASFAAQAGGSGRDGVAEREAFIAANASKKNSRISGLPADVYSVPIQSFYEPDKEVGVIFQRPRDTVAEQDAHLVRLLHRSSLHSVDTFFNHTRNRISYLARPGESRATGRAYNRFQPYDPGMMQLAFDIARVYYNWCEPRAFRLADDFESTDQALAITGHQRLAATARQSKRAVTREAKTTPAMRLGLARAPVRLETILYGSS